MAARYPPRVVLRLPLSKRWALGEFVEACLRDQVLLIAICGPGCVEMEDEIDALVVRDGSDEERFVVTTAHPDESIEDVIEFASNWIDPRPGLTVVTF